VAFTKKHEIDFCNDSQIAANYSSISKVNFLVEKKINKFGRFPSHGNARC
jgi:hypothetical protein